MRFRSAQEIHKLDNAEAFFYQHAGYSYDPKTETANEGRARCARELAAAERTAKERGWEVAWKLEEGDDCAFDDLTPAKEYYWATISEVDKDSRRVVLASLGCIGDPSYEYMRVVEAELALEALSEVERRAERAAEHVAYVRRYLGVDD